MKLSKNFMKLDVLTNQQQQNLEHMIKETEKDIKDTFIKYITKAKERFNAFVNPEGDLQQQLHTYLKDHTAEHGNYDCFNF